MDAIGKPLDRVDGRLKITGAATFAAEFELPGLVHAALVQSGVGAGRVTRVDDSMARAAKGVLDIITFESPAKVVVPSTRPTTATKAVFGGPEIQYNGQHIGVVIADTLERARAAADLMRFEYAPEKPRVNLKNYAGEAFLLPNAPPAVRGDLAQGRRSAAQTVSATYDIETEHHNPLEPHATIAVWEGDNLTVYSASQGVEGSRKSLADTFGIPADNVRVICPFVGGGFGSKGMTWMHVPIAALAARAVGRPVKLVLRRQEMFTGHGHRAHTIQSMELGAQSDGTLTIVSNDALNETSMKDNWREDTGRMTGMMYACQNVSTSMKIVRLNKMQPTYTRAPGEASGGVSLECAMDELAAKLGMDPIEFRLKNDTDIDGSNQKPFSSRALRECLMQGREAFGWKRA